MGDEIENGKTEMLSSGIGTISKTADKVILNEIQTNYCRMRGGGGGGGGTGTANCFAGDDLRKDSPFNTFNNHNPDLEVSKKLSKKEILSASKTWREPTVSSERQTASSHDANPFEFKKVSRGFHLKAVGVNLSYTIEKSVQSDERDSICEFDLQRPCKIVIAAMLIAYLITEHLNGDQKNKTTTLGTEDATAAENAAVQKGWSPSSLANLIAECCSFAFHTPTTDVPPPITSFLSCWLNKSKLSFFQSGTEYKRTPKTYTSSYSTFIRWISSGFGKVSDIISSYNAV